MSDAEELKLLREYALAATRTITDLAGGGSELFAKRVGDIYLADLPFCSQRIRERREALHRQLLEARKP